MDTFIPKFAFIEAIFTKISFFNYVKIILNFIANIYNCIRNKDDNSDAGKVCYLFIWIFIFR